MSCPAERRPPTIAYLLFDAHPAMTIPRTVIEPSVVRYSRPMLRSAPTTSCANGSTAHDASIGVNTSPAAPMKKYGPVRPPGRPPSAMSFLPPPQVGRSPDDP